MAQAIFSTDNLDLALTKMAAGCEVAYTGRHDGVFRFESVKWRALRERPRALAEQSFETALEQLVAREMLLKRASRPDAH